MSLKLSHVHKIIINTKARLTPFWLTHENCGGAFKKAHRSPFDWMECTTCGWDYMWWRHDENLTYPIVSPICTKVFFKSDDIFIYRDIEGDKRDELTYDEMMKARGPKSSFPDSQLFIRVSKKERTQFGNIFIEDINLFHENCGKVCTKYYPYYFCENCKVQFDVSSREDVYAIYKTSFEKSSNSVKTSKIETIYKPLQRGKDE